ncbi:MAG: hypothetical protein WDN72_01020 [Alphaproteobacteria bacterium]
MLTAQKLMGLSRSQLGADAKNQNAKLHFDLLDRRPPTAKPPPTSVGSWSKILRGHTDNIPSKHTTYEMHRQLHNRHLDADFQPSLIAIHEQALRERADELWAKANAVKEQRNLGGMVLACRLRLGESQTEFGERVGAYAGICPAPTFNAVHHWESENHLPVGVDDLAAPSLYRPLVAAMKAADAAPSALARSIREPWFTPQKEADLRTAFVAEVGRVNHTQIHHGIRRPLSGSKPLPELPPSAGVYSGSLSHGLAWKLRATHEEEAPARS